MPQQRDPGFQHPLSFRQAVRNPGASLKERYRDDPIGLAERFGLKLPEKPVSVMLQLGVISEEEAEERYGPYEPGLRELVEDVCNGTVTSAVVVGPRGGGKSQGVSFIEFVLAFLKDYDALNLGGSELQADQVYQYINVYVENDKEWKSLVVGELMRERTNLRDGNWIRVLAASQKSTRSPHAGGGGGKRRGGILVIDEEAEAEPGIVNSALPTINTARPSVNIRSSTFHNAIGTFADVVDNHQSMGYKLYRWDVFDVAERCDCVDVCQSPEPCFRNDHVENVINQQTGQVEEKVVHRAYCGGRAMYADGWVPVPEIHALWRRINRHHGTWEVEQMGSRPSTAGFVIKDQTKFSSNLTTLSGDELYVPGAPYTICVDWGCHDDQTEVLTEGGWKRFANLDLADKVAQFNKDSKKMSFVRPTRLTVKDWDGELLHFTGRKGVDLMVTPNHRLLTRYAWASKWEVERADEAECRSRPYMLGHLDWSGREKAKFVLPAVRAIYPGQKRGQRGWQGVASQSFDMDDWLEFVGYLLAEGGLCYRTSRSGDRVPSCIKMSQRHPMKTKMIRACMDRLGLDYQEYLNPKTGDTNWTLCGRQLFHWWVENIGTEGCNKRVPRQFLHLSCRQLTILFEAMMVGDGHWHNREQMGGAYYSTSPGLADDVQEIALRLGLRAVVRLDQEAVGNRKAKWRVLISQGADREIGKPSRVPYKGKVYCCTVPDEFIVTRRNGCVSYEGNTTAAGVGAWQEQWTEVGMKYALIACEQLEEYGIDEIVSAILMIREKWPMEFLEVAADIGGGGNYMNPHLRTNFGITVRDVNFGEVKEAAAAAWNVYNEAKKIVVPAEYERFAYQVRRWKRDAGGRIKKGNDHLCDMSICFFSKFVEQLGLSHLRVVPRTFQTGQHVSRELERGPLGDRLPASDLATGRAPIARSLSGKRNR